MIKIVRELSGSELDIATAMALGFKPKLSAFETLYWSVDDFTAYWYHGPVEDYNPSKNWKQSGGFIEEFGIEFKWVTDVTIETYSHIMEEKHAHGLNHLEAACRLIVLSFLGESVDIPEDILEVYNGKDTN